jgi:hypothetical protein
MAGFRVRCSLAAKKLAEAADDKQLTKTINHYGPRLLRLDLPGHRRGSLPSLRDHPGTAARLLLRITWHSVGKLTGGRRCPH